MNHSTHAGPARRVVPAGLWRAVAFASVAILASACAADPEPSAPFDGVVVGAREATPTTTSTVVASVTSTAPATTAPAPASNDVALAPAAPAAAAAAVAAPVATAAETASSIDDTLAEVDALLADVDRDLADTSDSN